MGRSLVRPAFFYGFLLIPPHDCLHHWTGTEARLAACARGGGVAVVDAFCDCAADGDLHCVGDWHRAQAARADEQLRQPVRAVLGRGVCGARPVRGLQRVVVPADSGVPGGQYQPVHCAQHAQDPAGLQAVQGKHPRAKPEGVLAQGRGHAGRAGRRRRAAHRADAGGVGLEGEVAAARHRARHRLDGGGQGRGGQQAGLPGRTQRHRADLHWRPVRWRPGGARADVVAGQDPVQWWRPDCRGARAAPPERPQPDLPRQPAGERRRHRRHGGADATHGCGVAGLAVRGGAEKVCGGVLPHRHAQAVCQRDRHPRPLHRRADARARGGEPPSELPGHRDLPVQL